MAVAALLRHDRARRNLAKAYRTSYLWHLAGDLVMAGSWEEVQVGARQVPLAIVVVDPYWSGRLDLTRVRDLAARAASTIAYADFRVGSSRPPRAVGSDVGRLLAAGVEQVVTLGADDSPSELSQLLERVLGAGLLDALLMEVRNRLTWKQTQAAQWAIRNGLGHKSVAAMAAGLQVTTRTLRRWFDDVPDLNPHVLLMWGRLLRATLLIDKSGGSPRDVAHLAGFRNTSALRSEYERLTGSFWSGDHPAEGFVSTAKSFVAALPDVTP